MLKVKNRKDLMRLLGGKQPSKYRNVRVDGFDSKGERDRFLELQMLEKAGAIQNLERQIEFKLEVNGVHVTKYISDFKYTENGKLIIEDFKGVRTKEYVLKRRLMLACLGIEIRETSQRKRK